MRGARRPRRSTRKSEEKAVRNGAPRLPLPLFPRSPRGYADPMASAVLPLFHLLGDPPDDKAFDFIQVEPLVSRSSAHDWKIPAHRHRDLFQIFLIERGGGEMTYEASILPFAAPAAKGRID